MHGCLRVSSSDPIDPYQQHLFSYRLVESIPLGLYEGQKVLIHPPTYQAWLELFQKANKTILIGGFYWSLLVKDTGDGFTSDPTGSANIVSDR